MADIYVDADIAGDSGDGNLPAVGAGPYGDLQFALDSTTQGATGDTFWLNGTEILTGTLDYTGLYGAPAYNKPCMIRGWNGADATTDGTGGIDGNNGNFTICAQGVGCQFHNLTLTNTGTAAIVTAFTGYGSGVSNCVVHNSSGNGIEGNGDAAFAVNNHIHDIGGIGITKMGVCRFNYLENGTKSFSAAIDPDTIYPCFISRNIISVTGTTNGILGYIQSVIQHNSILMTGGPAAIGIDNTQADGNSILNNVIEGFTTGISSDEVIPLYGGNHCYSNTNNYSVTGPLPVNFGDNEDRDSVPSPFAKGVTDNFANRFTYFAPVATAGNMQGLAYPSGCGLDKGAVQHADPAGALSFIHTRRNTLIGR